MTYAVQPINIRRRQLLQLALAAAMVSGLSACRDEATGLAQGDRFPDLALPYQDGRKELFADDTTVPLVVNFWASWCEPCRREMPSLEKLSTLFPSGELRVIGVTTDSDINLAREFSLQHRLSFPLLSDSGMALSNGVLRIPAFPMTYLLKRDRTIARIIVGGRDWADNAMVEEIEALLGVRRKG